MSHHFLSASADSDEMPEYGSEAVAEILDFILNMHSLTRVEVGGKKLELCQNAIRDIHKILERK